MQQIIDYLYNHLASGKHLMFFYFIISSAIGLPSLVALVLVNLKSRQKTLTYLTYFLSAKTCELVFLTFILYQQVNIPFGFRFYENVLFFSLESLAILLLPLFVNELFVIAHRRQINFIFRVLFGIGLLLINGPYLLGIFGTETVPVYLQEGISIQSLTSFKIYRCLFWIAYLYSFLAAVLKIKTMNNPADKKFSIQFMVVLFVLVFQPLVLIIKTFPETTFTFAFGYFFLNILLLKYAGRKFLEDLNLLPLDSMPGMSINPMILTEREKEVLYLLEQGFTNKNIGDRLYISETTVKTHLKNIYHKFGVNNRMRLLHRLRTVNNSQIIDNR